MAFRIRKGLNHSPDWYEEHCRAEDGGSAAFRAMLKYDMERIGADFDKELTYQENIPIYAEQWAAILKGEVLRTSEHISDRYDAILQAEIYRVGERENADGFNPSQQFKDEPFKTIDDLMTEHDLNANSIREFLKWRSRHGAVAKMKQKRVKEDKSKTALRKAVREMTSKRFFDYGEDSAK